MRNEAEILAQKENGLTLNHGMVASNVVNDITLSSTRRTYITIGPVKMHDDGRLEVDVTKITDMDETAQEFVDALLRLVERHNQSIIGATE